MAVFRVEKTKDFTVINNYHLRDKTLSLKAKGLLTLILSLPEVWNYNLKGLSRINREGVDAIRSAINELELAGYILRNRVRDKEGKLRGTEYVIYESPQEWIKEINALEQAMDEEAPATPVMDAISCEPTPDYPPLEKPMLENPAQENPTQYNTNTHTHTPTRSQKKDKTNTYQASMHLSNPYQSFTAPAVQPIMPASPFLPSTMPMLNVTPANVTPDYAITETPEEEYWRVRSEIRKNIAYSALKEDLGVERLDELVEIMTGAICSKKTHLTVNGEPVPIGIIRERLREVRSTHIEYVIECLKRCNPRINNIRKYLLTALYNAPSTISSYYDARVRYDRYNSIA